MRQTPGESIPKTDIDQFGLVDATVRQITGKVPQSAASPSHPHPVLGNLIGTAFETLGGLDDYGRIVPELAPTGQDRALAVASAKALLKKAGDTPVQINWKSLATSPLHLAVQSADPELVQMAMKHFSDDLMHPDAKGKTALDYALGNPRLLDALGAEALKSAKIQRALTKEHQRAVLEPIHQAKEAFKPQTLSSLPSAQISTTHTLDQKMRAVADSRAKKRPTELDQAKIGTSDD